MPDHRRSSAEPLQGITLGPSARCPDLTSSQWVAAGVLAIAIIEAFNFSEPAAGPLLLASIPLALFTLLVPHRVRSRWLLPLAVATWTVVYTCGVRATVAGVLRGFAVPRRFRRRQ